jgi:hypothetical protein
MIVPAAPKAEVLAFDLPHIHQEQKAPQPTSGLTVRAVMTATATASGGPPSVFWRVPPA